MRTELDFTTLLVDLLGKCLLCDREGCLTELIGKLLPVFLKQEKSATRLCKQNTEKYSPPNHNRFPLYLADVLENVDGA